MTGPVTTEALVDGSAEPMTETEIAAIMAEDPNYPPCPAPPPIPVRERYYLTECEHCGWVGSSEQCGGDAYPGDDDIVCPVCCSSIRGDSPNEADTAKHGEAVYQRIVTAEASLATATSELARLRAEGEAKDRRIALADRVKAQLEVAQNALVKIDRGGKPMREIASRALLDIAMVPYPQETPALARAATAREGQIDA